MCSHKKRRGERESGSEMEGGRKGEGKDNPQGLWLSLFQPQVLLPHTWSIPLPRALSSPPPPPNHFSNPFRRFPEGNGGNKGFQFLGCVSHMSREERGKKKNILSKKSDGETQPLVIKTRQKTAVTQHRNALRLSCIIIRGLRFNAICRRQ